MVLLAMILVTCGRAPSDLPPMPGLTQSPTVGAPTADMADADSYERVDISEDLYVRRIQDGVFMITHTFPWPGNSLLVKMKNSDLVLVDTPYTPEATQALLAWAETQFGEQASSAINTGFHYDNLGGNRYLIEVGIPVYGSDLTAKLLEEHGEAMRRMTLEWLSAPHYERYYTAHAALPYVAPTHLFDLEQGLQLEFGDESVQVYYPGPSHSPDNVVVYFPSRKLLFGTCMILGGDKVGNISDADLSAWPASVRNLARFDFEVLVPGHGDRFDPGLLDHTLDLLANFETPPAVTPSSTRPTRTPPPAYPPTPTDTPMPVESFPSPDGARRALIQDRGTLIIQEADGQQRELVVTGEISALDWFPDGRHIIYSERNLSQDIMARQDALWLVNVETGERQHLGKGYAPRVSPDGRHIAVLSGVLWGDACLVGYDVAILKLDERMHIVATYHQDDFTGLPGKADKEEAIASFHPVSIEDIEAPGRWESDTQLKIGLRWGCALPDDPESGLYLLDLRTLQATKIAELEAE